MSPKNISTSEVVVTRQSIPQAQPVQNQGTQYENIMEGIYVAPFIPIPAFDGYAMLGLIEYALLAALIIVGGIMFLASVKAHGQFRCKKCGKTYCWDKEIPETCIDCGAKLNLPKISVPK